MELNSEKTETVLSPLNKLFCPAKPYKPTSCLNSVVSLAYHYRVLFQNGFLSFRKISKYLFLAIKLDGDDYFNPLKIILTDFSPHGFQFLAMYNTATQPSRLVTNTQN